MVIFHLLHHVSTSSILSNYYQVYMVNLYINGTLTDAASMILTLTYVVKIMIPMNLSLT